jgi:hypothetical protein
VALGLELIVRNEGAIPATIALMDGQIRVGLSHGELERISAPDEGSMKVSLRDVVNCLGQKVSHHSFGISPIIYAYSVMAVQLLQPLCGLPIELASKFLAREELGESTEALNRVRHIFLMFMNYF